MSKHPDKLRFFLSESTEEARMREGYDVLSVQQGRFASYIERETPIPETNLSTFTNYIALPDGFLIIGISLDTMLNSLLVGSDRDFLPVAKRKYPTFGRGVSVYEGMQTALPKPGQIWIGMNNDPHDGAEISVVCSAMPVDRSIVSDSEALVNEIKQPVIREISSNVIETGFEVLAEMFTPIAPISDVLAFKRDEFLSDIRDPKKVCSAVIDGLMKKYGWQLVDKEVGRFLEEHRDQLINNIGVAAYNILVKAQENRENIMTVADAIKILRVANTAKK